MIDVDIPGRGKLQLENLVLDFNGTMGRDGELLPGVAERLNRLAGILDCYVMTADTFGTARKACEDIKCTVETLPGGSGAAEAKEDFVTRLNAGVTAAVGNGSNDTLMLQKAALGIFVVEAEGSSVEGLLKADVVCRSITEALDMLLNPKRIVATLRK